MKQSNSRMTIVLSVLVIIIGGVTAINWHWDESWKLFWDDFKNGFQGFGWLYTTALASVFVLAAAAAVLLHWILSRISQRKINVRLYHLACILILAVCIMVNIKSMVKSEAKRCWQPTKTIGHSFGAIDGTSYTGSWEAFEENYAQGRRVMEVDILLTSDDKCVLKHEWDCPVQEGISEENVPDEETFLSTKLDGKYTPMSFEQLCELMVKYPDLWVVTDTKYVEDEIVLKQFQVMTDTIRNTGGGHSEIWDRFIVQVYNEQMYELLSSRYDFKTYIFTTYQLFYTDDIIVGTFRDVCRYCVNNGITVVTVNYGSYKNHGKELQHIADTYGIKLYVHTVNNFDTAKELLNAGVGVYTDKLYDRDF